MRWKIYVETSVVSYLTSPLSRDLVVAGHQQITQEWWTTQRDKVELFVSQTVLEEASVGRVPRAFTRPLAPVRPTEPA